MTVQDETMEIAEKALPLIAPKKVPIKIYAVVTFIILIILFNLFGRRNFDSQTEENQKNEVSESYELTKVNPLTKGTQISQEKSADVLEKEAQFKIKMAYEEAKAKDFVERLQAPQVVEAEGVINKTNIQNANSVAGIGEGSVAQDSNRNFLLDEGNKGVKRSFAVKMPALSSSILQGKFIFGSLATAINSDLPGQVSAIVSQNIYSEQGRNILIPRGSRLVGEYRSGLTYHQQRLFIVWTRIIEPNGASILIGSEGTDALGKAGLTGDVNNHFFARFGTATLISLIGAGAANVGVNPNDQYNSMAAYRESAAEALSQQANNTLSQTANIPPTINIPQGERIVIFVNKDLDFSGVVK